VASGTLRGLARLPEHRPRHFRRGTHLLRGNQLNRTIAALDAGPCIVYDLQVIPNDDPAKGSTLPMFESELLQTLDEALKQHANKYKVWNLSLGSGVGRYSTILGTAGRFSKTGGVRS
jgi:hypothetical protein